MTPQITIITPVYKGRAFIESCLESVTGQGCPSVEHVVVDGGSDDGTVAVLEAYARRHPHVRWVSE
ncbi:MAG: glycosyltransferase, partial [Cytophagales bacterium]|nr:glycosyltransferase [Cytophagales bacterium]